MDPHVGIDNVPHRFGKLYCTGKPVLLFAGTGSRQGKFSLQLEMRDRFIKNGYCVGQIGTEPSSLLFGMDEVFPSGYGGNISLSAEDTISLLNLQIHNLEEKNPDIILVGTQSHILQYNMGNLAFYPLLNYYTLLASDPDGIILCVNYGDPFEYIKRCIGFLENFIDSKVLAIVVFPIEKDREWKIISQRKETLDKSKLDEYIELLKCEIRISVYTLSDQQHIDIHT